MMQADSSACSQMNLLQKCLPHHQQIPHFNRHRHRLRLSNPFKLILIRPMMMEVSLGILSPKTHLLQMKRS